MIYNFKTLLLSFLIVIFPFFSHGFIVVNFEELEEGKTRIIALNTIKQKLLLYKEVEKKSKDTLGGYVIKLDSSGNVKILKEEKYDSQREPIIIRSKGLIYAYSNWGSKKLNNYTIRSSEEIMEKTPQEIDAILPKKVKNKEPSSFMVNIEGKKDKNYVRNLGFLSNERKGSLGELGTTLTMLSFGYTQLPSKYGPDNGLDGVFESFSKKNIWLTESKQDKTTRAAKGIMEEFLNEREIWKKIQKMEKIGSSEVQKTAALIRKYLDKRPRCIYKMAYRMMDKGRVQCQINPLNIQELSNQGAKLFHVPSEEKTKAVRNILSTFEPAPKNQLALALQANTLESIPLKQTLSIVAKAYGLTKKDRQRLTSVAGKVSVQKTPKDNPKKCYNRDNLFSFLVYLKNSKKYNPPNIARDLKGEKDTSNSTITRLMKNKDYLSEKDYSHVWDALVAKYAQEFQDWLSE